MVEKDTLHESKWPHSFWKLTVSRGKRSNIDFSEFAASPVQMAPSTPMKSPDLLESNSFNTPVKQKVIRTPKTNSSKKKAKVTIEPGSLPPPKDWQDIYSLVEELRADQTAPVDSDGCQALAEKNRNPQVFRFQVGYMKTHLHVLSMLLITVFMTSQSFYYTF
jgi:hypothetical protein